MGSVTLGFFRVQGLGMGWGDINIFFPGFGVRDGFGDIMSF